MADLPWFDKLIINRILCWFLWPLFQRSQWYFSCKSPISAIPKPATLYRLTDCPEAERFRQCCLPRLFYWFFEFTSAFQGAQVWHCSHYKPIGLKYKSSSPILLNFPGLLLRLEYSQPRVELHTICFGLYFTRS